MSTRISSVALLSVLAGCGDRPGAPPVGASAADILCAHGDAPMRRACTVEQMRRGDGIVLTLRHSDGGFRRLRVAADGRDVVAADGADAVRSAMVGPGTIEIAIDDDRYRLPAIGASR